MRQVWWARLRPYLSPKLSKDLLTAVAPAVARTSSAGNPEPMDTIPATDVYAPAGGFASAKLFATQKGRVSLAKENIIVWFRNCSEKKDDRTEKLKKENDEVCKKTWVLSLWKLALACLFLHFRKAVSLRVNLYAYRSNQFICVIEVKPTGVELIKAEK